ncbi:hypothetical protein [Micromonospora sp. CPCC 206061]
MDDIRICREHPDLADDSALASDVRFIATMNLDQFLAVPMIRQR